MNLKQKENFFKYLAKNFDSMDYPPIILWKKKKREDIKEGWRKRVKEISAGAVDYPGLYIHIPYCQTKCFFCKFRTRVSNSAKIIGQYLKCLKEEIDEFSPIFKKISFKTLYLAGGTPTLFSASQLGEILNTLERKFNLKETYQRLIESTPATISQEKLEILKKHRFNRLTIGVQAVDEKVLGMINRRNQTKDMVRRVFYMAKSAGIEIINLDLVAGLPGQTTHSFLGDLDFILELKPDAFHLYSYEEEDQVIFYKIGKKIKEKDRIRRDRMLKLADSKIKRYGYRHYRNEPYLLSWRAANFQFQFRYFANGSLLGLGAGALSYIPGHYAYHNSWLDDYLSYRLKKKFPPCLDAYRLNKKECRINYVINNIRTGVDKKKYLDLFGIDFDREFRKEIESLKKLNRLQEGNDKVRLIAKDNLESRAYSKFFYSSKVVRGIEKNLNQRNERNRFKNEARP